MRKAPVKQHKTQFARQKFQELPRSTPAFYVISVNNQHGMLAYPHWQDEQMAQRGLINTTSTPQHQLTGHQKRYHDHQATIEHLQQDIARIRHQQVVIVARFMQEVLPLEHQYLRTVYAKTSRLLSFAGKKSLGNGVVEGHVNRLKMLKRQMYGRAGFELLRRRVMSPLA